MGTSSIKMMHGSGSRSRGPLKISVAVTGVLRSRPTVAPRAPHHPSNAYATSEDWKKTYHLKAVSYKLLHHRSRDASAVKQTPKTNYAALFSSLFFGIFSCHSVNTDQTRKTDRCR